MAECPKCGAGLTPGHRFCGQCGAAADPASTVSLPAPAETAEIPSRRDRVAHYRLEHVIAEGGMGVVFRAFDERLERPVALKLLREELATDEEFRRRFTREWRGAASLDHPNILPVFDAGEDDGALFIVTRLVEGEDLRRVIAREGPLAPARAIRVVEQIAAALDYAHERGIVHRDVKPANILLVPAGAGEPEHAYLIDFGIIKRAEASGPAATRAGNFVGTPDYAAPEQILGEPLTGRADQYALAGVLYHCLAGRAPYADESAAAILQAHLSAAAPRLAAERPALPVALDRAVARAMDKNPSRRFSSCRAFVAEAQMESPETVFEQPRAVPAAAPAVPDEPRRNPRLLIGLAAAIVVLLAGGAAAAAGGMFKRDRAKPEHQTAAVARPSATPQKPKPKEDPTPTPTQAPARPHDVALDVGGLTFEPQHMKGYEVSLPAGWQVSKDEPQPSDGSAKRVRSSATDPDTGVFLGIDRITHFDTAPEDNRTALEAAYAQRGGYRFISEDEYDLAGRPTYEWRYRITDPSEGRIHRADLIFKEGPAEYAVLASGHATDASLAELAKSVAESVRASGSAGGGDGSRPRDERLPEDGVYTGTGTQHIDGSDNSGVALVMSFGHRSTVQYTRLGCTARLVPAGYDGSRRVYRERFTSGRCDEPGTWKVLKTSDTEVEADWSTGGGAYTVSASLTR